jgi:hypothetical protein
MEKTKRITVTWPFCHEHVATCIFVALGCVVPNGVHANQTSGFGPSLEQPLVALWALACCSSMVLWFGLLGCQRTPRLIGLDKSLNQFMDTT